MADKCMNEGPKWLLLILWLGANCVMFGYFFAKFYLAPEFYYLRVIVGLGLPVARGSAAALNFNMALILLPVCRNLISFIRGSCRCLKRNFSRQLDRHIEFHKACAYMICFWTAVHYYAHTFNFEYLYNAWHVKDYNNTDQILRYHLSMLPVLANDIISNGTWTNPIRSTNNTIMYELAKAVPGYTGVIATVALCVMMSSAVEFIRRNYFEVFWYTHHLFIVFFAAVIAHGFGGVVRGMTNINTSNYTTGHNVTLCAAQPNNWGSDECPPPNFGPGQAQTWMWVIGPCFLYVVERLIRFIRSQEKVEIVKVIQHPARVVELRMRKSGFTMTSGQYIFVQCPMISKLEWHPFTLTSSPDEDYFSVHIREAGDWTSALHKKFHCTGKPDEVPVNLNALPRLLVDGPFGTCSEDVFRYDVAILVGAGIGVTPFASILKHVWYRKIRADTQSKLKKVYFFWMGSETHAFGWFVDLLKALEAQMIESNQPDFVDIRIYWTRGWKKEQVACIVAAADGPDPVLGLSHQTNYGRPDWNRLFGDIKDAHPRTNIGVFLCGPAELAVDLEKMSNKHSSKSTNETHFAFNKENF